VSKDNPSMEPFRIDERKRRRWWAAYLKEHPAPRRTSKWGRWELPPYVGPESAQTSVLD